MKCTWNIAWEFRPFCFDPNILAILWRTVLYDTLYQTRKIVQIYTEHVV